jgi:hypothetical protein
MDGLFFSGNRIRVSMILHSRKDITGIFNSRNIHPVQLFHTFATANHAEQLMPPAKRHRTMSEHSSGQRGKALYNVQTLRRVAGEGIVQCTNTPAGSRGRHCTMYKHSGG